MEEKIEIRTRLTGGHDGKGGGVPRGIYPYKVGLWTFRTGLRDLDCKKQKNNC